MLALRTLALRRPLALLRRAVLPMQDVVATSRETQLNIHSNRLNLIMKKVTGWAAIVAILVIGGGLYALFKRRDWL